MAVPRAGRKRGICVLCMFTHLCFGPGGASLELYALWHMWQYQARGLRGGGSWEDHVLGGPWWAFPDCLPNLCML